MGRIATMGTMKHAEKFTTHARREIGVSVDCAHLARGKHK
jgi:hypothetical protein